MNWFILFVGIIVICGVAALVLGRLDGGLGRATTSLSHQPLPAERLTDADLEALRFDVTARGYRMGQVDGVLDRLRRELRERDEEIAVLRADLDRDGAPPQRNMARAEVAPARPPEQPNPAKATPARPPGTSDPAEAVPTRPPETSDPATDKT